MLAQAISRTNVTVRMRMAKIARPSSPRRDSSVGADHSAQPAWVSGVSSASARPI